MNKTTLARIATLTFCLALVIALGTGCAHKKKGVAIAPTYPQDQPSTWESTSTPGSQLPNINQEELLFDPHSDSGLKPVYFDFDKYDLRPDARATLQENADKIKQVPNVVIQIEGHCDERGTQEYNLALGERRALATRDYLMRLGVSGDRLITISYGEEDPAVPGHDEAAWAKNRRCEFNRPVPGMH